MPWNHLVMLARARQVAITSSPRADHVAPGVELGAVVALAAQRNTSQGSQFDFHSVVRPPSANSAAQSYGDGWPQPLNPAFEPPSSNLISKRHSRAPPPEQPAQPITNVATVTACRNAFQLI